MSSILPTGKLKTELLERLLQSYRGIKDERVVVGPRIGEDAAAIDFGDTYLIAKTDPITFATEQIGWYVVTINSNDIATRGATPKWFLLTALLPEGATTEAKVEEIFKDLSRACQNLNIALCGGHTEITYGLDRPILIGQMLGEVEKNKLVTTSGAKAGDDVVLVKSIAIEATAIIAKEKEEELRSSYSPEFITRAKNFLYDPGISVVKEALIANDSVKVHSMHDPTEGGLAMGLYEVCKASDTGITIYQDKITILPETEELCGRFALNPLGAISSGALVVTLDPTQTEKLISIYQDKDIPCAVIGKITEKESGLKINRKRRWHDLDYLEKDEITKIF